MDVCSRQRVPRPAAMISDAAFCGVDSSRRRESVEGAHLIARFFSLSFSMRFAFDEFLRIRGLRGMGDLEVESFCGCDRVSWLWYR